MSADSDDIVESLDSFSRDVRAIANAILPSTKCGGTDASGGHVESLTEAVMGMTAGLIRIAESIESIADAICKVAKQD